MNRQGMFYVVAASQILSGAGFLVVMKIQDMWQINGQYFAHPLWFSVLMFSAMLLTGIPWLFVKQENETCPYVWRKTRPFFIMATADLIGHTLIFTGLNLTTPSIYQMLQCLNLIFIALLRPLIVKKRTKLTRQQILALFIIFLGVFLAGLANAIWVDKSYKAKSPILGIFVCIAGQAVLAIEMNIEERLVQDNHPLFANAAGGFAGLIYTIPVCIILYFVPCADPDSCINGRVADIPFAFTQMGENNYLILTSTLMLLLMTVVSGAGITIAKYRGSVTRATLFQLRMTLVWIISLSLGWEEFLWLECVGFVVFIVPGNLIYNDVIKLGFLEKKSKLEENLV